MNKFKGNFFDGISTLPVPVEVSVNPSILMIEPEDKTKELIRWPHKEISELDLREGKTIIKFGKIFPFQMLELKSRDFYDEIKKQNPPAPYLKSPYRHFNRFGASALFMALGLIAVFLLLCYFYLIPWTMSGVAEIFPQDLEKKMGVSMKENFIQEEKIDINKTKNINHFFKNLKVDTDYSINITVVKSNVKNAFALPGGEIVVFSAILESMKSYSELVALLGHESGHIERRHTLKLFFKSLSNYIIISAVFQDFSGLMAVMIENASMIERLSYNRDVEEESDNFGLKVLIKNRVDPNGMVYLFQHLEEKSGITDKVPEFMQTHPKLEKRIERVKRKIRDKKFSVIQNDSLSYYWKKLKDR